MTALLAEIPSPSSRPPSSRPDADSPHGPRHHIRKRQNCARFIDIDLAHRLLNHKGKCRHLHGHRLRIEVTCSMLGVDHLGLVIDFSEIKARIGGWLDKNWDHGAVLNAADKELIALLHKQNSKVYVLDCNPTAENLATHLLRQARLLLNDIEHVDVAKVRIWETPNCWAEAT